MLSLQRSFRDSLQYSRWQSSIDCLDYIAEVSFEHPLRFFLRGNFHLETRDESQTVAHLASNQ